MGAIASIGCKGILHYLLTPESTGNPYDPSFFDPSPAPGGSGKPKESLLFVLQTNHCSFVEIRNPCFSFYKRTRKPWISRKINAFCEPPEPPDSLLYHEANGSQAEAQPRESHGAHYLARWDGQLPPCTQYHHSACPVCLFDARLPSMAFAGRG